MRGPEVLQRPPKAANLKTNYRKKQSYGAPYFDTLYYAKL